MSVVILPNKGIGPIVKLLGNKKNKRQFQLLHEKLDPVNEAALISLKSTLHSVISKRIFCKGNIKIIVND